MKSGWYIPGFGGDSLLAIKINLIEKDEIGENFYWADEPIGHSVLKEELLTKEDAIQQLIAIQRKAAFTPIEIDDEDTPIDNRYMFEPLEKEISVEDMQKIVDANEKIVKELKLCGDTTEASQK
jgi:hypothetical protein